MFQRGDQDQHTETDTPDASCYRRIVGRSRRPQGTPFLEIVSENYDPYVASREKKGDCVPRYVKTAFKAVMECGDINLGSATFVCVECELEVELPFSCAQRGMCPSCLSRRMRDRGEFLVENVIGDTPIRHWVHTFPPPLRTFLGFDPELTSDLLAQFLSIVFALLRRKARREIGKNVGRLEPGGITAIQRWSSFLDLNLHFHCLVTDGVFYRDPETKSIRFHRVAPPTPAEIAAVAWKMCRKTCSRLMRRGMWKDLEDPKGDTAGETKYGCVSLGSRKKSRRRLVRFFGKAGHEEADEPEEVDGAAPFDVYAGDATAVGDRESLRKLVEYILSPPFTYGQVTRAEDGRVHFRPKRPRRDGTQHRVFEPLEFMHTLATMVPRPRLHTTRFHGVYARRHAFRREVVPKTSEETEETGEGSEKEDFGDLTIALAEMSKLVFAEDLRCPECKVPMLLKKLITANMIFEGGRRIPREESQKPP